MNNLRDTAWSSLYTDSSLPPHLFLRTKRGSGGNEAADGSQMNVYTQQSVVIDVLLPVIDVVIRNRHSP